MYDEINLEVYIRDHPNLIIPELTRLRRGNLGDGGEYYLEQTRLDSGILDLAFIAEKTVHLVELKRDNVDENTAEQLCGYARDLEKIYPNHVIKGYLVGTSCPDRRDLEQKLSGLGYDIKIMIAPEDFPLFTHAKFCSKCQRAYGLSEQKCRCGSRDFA